MAIGARYSRTVCDDVFLENVRALETTSPMRLRELSRAHREGEVRGRGLLWRWS